MFKIESDLISLYDYVKENGGATFHVESGQFYSGQGFGVAVAKNLEEVVDNFNTLGQEMFMIYLFDYIAINSKLLGPTTEDFYLGLWVEHNKLYIDVTQVVATKRDALVLAKERNQLAIFDFNTFTTVRAA